LKLFEQFITQNNKTPQSVLDLGCGSGILSFILAKSYKNAKIYAVDANKYAV
jgi:methylase of polypeptide subunit release factors